MIDVSSFMLGVVSGLALAGIIVWLFWRAIARSG